MTELPSSLRVEHTLAVVNVNGVAIVLGQERLHVSGPDETSGRFVVNASIDWVRALQLPMPCVKLLAKQLNELVSGFEARFGEVPQDLVPAPRPTLAVFNPEIVTSTEPEPQPEPSVEAQKNFRYSDEFFRRPLSASYPGVHQDRRQLPAAGPPPESEL